jgi:hypothetical protein
VRNYHNFWWFSIDREDLEYVQPRIVIGYKMVLISRAQVPPLEIVNVYVCADMQGELFTLFNYQLLWAMVKWVQYAEFSTGFQGMLKFKAGTTKKQSDMPCVTGWPLWNEHAKLSYPRQKTRVVV